MVAEDPTNNGTKRDPNSGRFLKGTKGGPGNPHAKRVHRLRSALLKAVTPEDMQEVMFELLNKAKCGDVAAAKLLFEYTVGKPKESVEIEGPTGGLTFIVKEATRPRADDDE